MKMFKQAEKKPFSYPSIEMQKSPRAYKWIVIFVLALILAIFFWISLIYNLL